MCDRERERKRERETETEISVAATQLDSFKYEILKFQVGTPGFSSFISDILYDAVSAV